jgi:drug/metabolite transporter (DMT)-like permease
VAIAKKSPKAQTVATDVPAKKKLLTTTPIIMMIVCGICIAVNNVLNLYLSGAMDSAVFFPIVNGGGLILTTLSALILFKEKLSVKRWIGIIFGIVAVILLCNPFS